MDSDLCLRRCARRHWQPESECTLPQHPLRYTGSLLRPSATGSTTVTLAPCRQLRASVGGHRLPRYTRDGDGVYIWMHERRRPRPLAVSPSPAIPVSTFSTRAVVRRGAGPTLMLLGAPIQNQKRDLKVQRVSQVRTPSRASTVAKRRVGTGPAQGHVTNIETAANVCARLRPNLQSRAYMSSTAVPSSSGAATLPVSLLHRVRLSRMSCMMTVLSWYAVLPFCARPATQWLVGPHALATHEQA